MIDPETKEQLRNMCLDTLAFLRKCQGNSSSPAVDQKIEHGISELKNVLKGFDNPDLTDQEFIQLADKITLIGKDLITYGHLIMPPNNKN
jgi:hypothetical protein